MSGIFLVAAGYFQRRARKYKALADSYGDQVSGLEDHIGDLEEIIIEGTDPYLAHFEYLEDGESVWEETGKKVLTGVGDEFRSYGIDIVGLNAATSYECKTVIEHGTDVYESDIISFSTTAEMDMNLWFNYREANAGEWQSTGTSTKLATDEFANYDYGLSGLNSATEYEVKAMAQPEAGGDIYESEVITFTTD